MAFKVFGDAVAKQFEAMSSQELYVVDTTDIFDTYLKAFPQGTNPIFRVRTEHDCSCCKNFVRNIGHVVAIENGRLVTVWDVDVPHPYDVVAETMAEHIRSLPIRDVFRTKWGGFGKGKTIEVREDGTTHAWHHFHGKVQHKHRAEDSASVQGRLRSARGVFKRGLEELSPEAVTTVRELIEQGALYRGEEHLDAVLGFQAAQRDYFAAPEKDIFTWEQVQSSVARFRNTVIGTLVQDLSEGVDLERAVKSFETKVAPTNYKRPTALITQRMVDDAVKTLKGMGLEQAVERRFARLSDVSVNNVLWASGGAQTVMKDGLTTLLMDEVKGTPVNVDKATPIGMDDFMTKVAPGAQDMKVFVENRHLSNFVSLTAPVHPDASGLFKWGNNFAWSYDGEVADSVKQRVKKAGGNINADLRISLAWFNTDDLDIHCDAPGYREIYYGRKQGVLDVDMNVSRPVRDPVENLAFERPASGVYEVSVKNYTRRESIDTGFTLEVECDGVLRVFSSAKSPANQKKFNCLTVTMDQGLVKKIETDGLTEGSSSQDKWGVQTEQLVPVTTLMHSPNHWDGEGTGNKHWIFALDGCKNPDQTRGIYNEFLSPALEKHRKVFEVLGAKTKCPVADDQISGLGFSSTRHDTVAVVVSEGAKSRAYKIQM